MKHSSDRRVLFVHNAATRFVQDDLDILTDCFDVREWYVSGRADIRLIGLLRQLRRSDLVFCWFASWHSLFPALLARCLDMPVIVVAGGYDTASLPEAGYGSQRGGLRKLVANAVLNAASLIVVNSHAALKETRSIPHLAGMRLQVVHHGVRSIGYESDRAREDLVVTVGAVWRENLLRKGLLPFVQTAALLPDMRFILVGKWNDDSIDTLREHAAPNVEFTGFLDDTALKELLQRANVYVQASLHEGFGLSVAEAMTAGCWPVVTNTGSLPEVVGAHGTIIQDNSPQSIAQGIMTARMMDLKARRLAAQHVERSFTLEHRKQELRTLIMEQCSQ